LQDIFFITLWVICGADNWVAIEEFGEVKEGWFTELLGLENGIPSHDTCGDVFALIDTEEFSECFSKHCFACFYQKNWLTIGPTPYAGDFMRLQPRSLEQGDRFL